MTLLHSMY